MKKCITGNEYPEVYRSDTDRWQDGEYTVVRTTQWSAPGCHCGCGILAYIDKDGKCAKVEGDPNNGFSRGTLCMRCLDIVEAMYAPERLKYPMKRDRADRGKDKWERITWDEAYDLIVEKTRYYQGLYGNGTVMVMQGTGRNCTSMCAPSLSYVGFKTPSNCGGFLSGDSCYSPRASVMALMAGCFTIADMSQGFEKRFDAPEWKLPEVILQWGCDAIRSNPDGFLGHWMVECMKRGSKLVIVDPRLTWMAAKAEVWLNLRPATDGALAMAMCNIIDAEDLVDHDFIDKWSYGYNDFIEACRQMTPEMAAEICCLDVEKIYEAARLIGHARPTALQWGLKLDQQVDATPASQAIEGMIAMTGNIDTPGGCLLMVDHAYHLQLSTFNNNKYVPEEEKQHILGQQRFPMRNTGANGNMGHSDTALECIESDGKLNDLGMDFPIKMLIFYGHNPLANMAAEAPRVYEALEHTEFNVNMNVVMTPTIMAAVELVVPIAMGLERNSMRAWWWPLRSIQQAADTYYEAKTDETFCAELMNRLNPESPIPDNDIDWLNMMLASSDYAKLGKTWEDLCHDVISWPEWHYKKYETGEVRYDGKPGFNTATGRFEFTPIMFPTYGLPLGPYYEEPRESPVSTPELAAEYPIILMTGRRSWEFFHSEHRGMAMMREFHPNPVFEISPETAAEYDIKDGDWCWIENHRGRCRQTAKVTTRVQPGMIMAEHGWWFPEGEPENLFGVFDSNINNLTTACAVGKSGYGAPYNGLLCKVYKCTEENSKILPTEQVTKLGGFKYERNHIYQ